MITLHQFSIPPDGVSASPFCAKLELWLKLTGLPYRSDESGDFAHAPKGKLPWITDSDGTTLGDSRLIIEHLVRTRGVDPDAGLTGAQRAVSLLVSALVEDRLYQALVWWRWIHDPNYRILRDAYFGDVPEAARESVAGQARAGVQADLRGHGLGRHTPDEIAAIGRADVAALATLVAGDPWLFGDRPTTADCTVWAMVANLLSPLFETPLGDEARRHPALLAYHQRGRELWFPAAATA